MATLTSVASEWKVTCRPHTRDNCTSARLQVEFLKLIISNHKAFTNTDVSLCSDKPKFICTATGLKILRQLNEPWAINSSIMTVARVKYVTPKMNLRAYRDRLKTNYTRNKIHPKPCQRHPFACNGGRRWSHPKIGGNVTSTSSTRHWHAGEASCQACHNSSFQLISKSTNTITFKLKPNTRWTNTT